MSDEEKQAKKKPMLLPPSPRSKRQAESDKGGHQAVLEALLGYRTQQKTGGLLTKNKDTLI